MAKEIWKILNQEIRAGSHVEKKQEKIFFSREARTARKRINQIKL